MVPVLLLKFFTSLRKDCICAVTWQNQQNECVQSEDSDQPGHLPSLIQVFALRSVGSLKPKHSPCRHKTDRTVDTSADLSLLVIHSHIVDFLKL